MYDWQERTGMLVGEEMLEHFRNSTVAVIGVGGVGGYAAEMIVRAGIGHLISKTYFISPIVNMEKLIADMMQWANVTEAELRSKSVIHTAFGEDLSWKYLCYVREHPIDWKVPTSILYGSCDNLTSFETVSDFAKKHGATLTVMESGEHWFHTEEQMRFLDDWIRSREEREAEAQRRFEMKQAKKKEKRRGH